MAVQRARLKVQTADQVQYRQWVGGSERATRKNWVLQRLWKSAPRDRRKQW